MEVGNMETVEYPSPDFEKKTENLIDKRESFIVFVPRSSKKHPMVLEKMHEALGMPYRYSGKWSQIVGAFRVFDFLRALASPLSGEDYRVDFEDNGDLTIHFTAK